MRCPNPIEARTAVWVGLGLAAIAGTLYAYRSYARSSCVSTWYDTDAHKLSELATVEASTIMASLFGATPEKYKGNPTLLAQDTFNVLWQTGTFSKDVCSGWGDAQDEVKPLVLPSLIAMAVARTGHTFVPGAGVPGMP
jgi:hypothetical protein